MAETSGQLPAARGAAWRRRQRRLRSMLRRERVRPFAWSWLQPFTTVGVGGSRRTKAYGYRSQPARVLPSTSNFLLMMAGPREGSGRRPCWSRDRRGRWSGTLGSGSSWSIDSRSLCRRWENSCPTSFSSSPLSCRSLPSRLSKCRRSSWTRLRSAQRIVLRQPQMVEQLVHVPTVMSYLLLQQLTAEQIVDTPVPGGDGGGGRGGLQGSLPRQNSATLHVEQTYDIPVPGREEGSVEVFKDLSQD